tara:strand:- start:1787 stop:3454 length:1668 start_codon:yes stop_codon:yes gene_type:complete
MVEMWELEWNSSMMQHGVDMGTMEFIFAKGGTLKDFNYVMLDTNDDTWEPLIKAVAERENSHPDIIRKNVPGVPANAAPGFFGVPDTYRPAVQMQMNPVDGHNYTVAAQNRKQARELLAAQRVAEADRRLYNAQQAGERPRIRDLAQTGQKGAALGQGLKDVGNIGLGLAAGGAYGLGSALGMTQGGREAYGKFGRGVVDAGKAAGGYLARKFPGVKDRMGRFMQGIKAAPGAFKDYMGERRDLREGRARRELLESGASRRQDYSNRMVPGSEGYDQQMKNYDRGMMQRYFPDGLPKYPEGHEKAGQTMTVDDALRSEISDIGTQQANRRGFRGALRDRMDPGVDVSVEGIDIDEPLAGVSDPMLDADATPPEAEEAPSSVTFTSKPEEEAPPETQAGPPTPVEPDVAEVTEPEMDDPAIAFGDEMAGLAGYKSGGSRRKAAEIARGMFDNKPASYEEIVAATGKAGYRSKLANAIAEYHGISPTQAVQVVQAADAGNPQAQEVVEEAANKSPISFESKPDDDDDEDPVGAGLMELSEDKHHASWDSLLKGLNIR